MERIYTEEQNRTSCVSNMLLVQGCEAVKAGMLHNIELARDVVATERGSCRETLIGHERNTIVNTYSTTI